MTAPASTGLRMRTMKCEGCGCDWSHPCYVDLEGKSFDRETQLGILADLRAKRPPRVSVVGCSWNIEYWRKGRAVCSACVANGKVKE